MTRSQPDDYGVALYWLPVGAGGYFVRFNGRVYEAVVAGLQRRSRRDLYHSALEVRLPTASYIIEMTPVGGTNGGTRGVVAEGAVGARFLAASRLFRYEVRRWRDGTIPDIDEAVASPQRLTDSLAVARRILDLVPAVPRHVWGRDALQIHDMWNSNSLISWLLASAGVDLAGVALPPNGRAPGWLAGLAAARG